jgi:gluconokinase
MILTIDIGGTSVRALLFDGRGVQIPGLEARRPSSLRQTADGGVEADAEEFLGTVSECIDEALVKVGVESAAKSSVDGSGVESIDGVAFSTFWHSLVGVSREGRAVTPLYTLGDSRSGPACERLAKMVDAAAVHQRTGCVVHPSYPPAKLLWLKETKRDVFDRVAWWCSIGEYIQYRLFGRRLCSISIASGSGLWNRIRCEWDAELLETLGISEEQLSTVGDMDSPFVGLSHPYGERWPSLRSVPWYPALADGACSSIGSGCTGPSRAAVMIGTTGAMRIVVPEAPQRIPSGLWCYRVDRARAVIGGAIANGGDLYEWLTRTLRLEMPTDALDAEILGRGPASHGLTVLPYLSGERSPGWRSDARAAVLGIDGGTTSMDVLQAAMESVAYCFASIWRLLCAALPPVAQLVATGGALQKSRAWNQILADVLGEPITLSRVSEASARGAALLALEASGAIGRVEEVDPFLGATFEPRSDFHGVHAISMNRFENYYRKLYGG